MARIEFYYWT